MKLSRRLWLTGSAASVLACTGKSVSKTCLPHISIGCSQGLPSCAAFSVDSAIGAKPSAVRTVAGSVAGTRVPWLLPAASITAVCQPRRASGSLEALPLPWSEPA